MSEMLKYPVKLVWCQNDGEASGECPAPNDPRDDIKVVCADAGLNPDEWKFIRHSDANGDLYEKDGEQLWIWEKYRTRCVND